MMRVFLICLALPVVLAACAAPEMTPEPPVNCAGPVVEGEKDGGLGGTGNEPKPCDEAQIMQ